MALPGNSQTCSSAEHVASYTFLSSHVAYSLLPTMPGPLAQSTLQGSR